MKATVNGVFIAIPELKLTVSQMPLIFHLISTNLRNGHKLQAVY